jgi:hypothetical protein
MKEKVGSLYLPVSAKLRLTVGQSAHMDILPARIAGGSTSTANSGFGRLLVVSKDSRNDVSICCRVSYPPLQTREKTDQPSIAGNSG